MQLQGLFAKPVDRPIEGVIKADDDASLRIEVEEYVLTNEVEKRLEAFFDAYNRYQNAMGVWISGFFGSGKSHLLKILALLLADRTVEGLAVAKCFLSKCQDNKILAASIHKAVSIPSRSILFNIDQKADVISKTQVDALLSVFVKVFDESCGYYGKQGYLAHFERQLDEDGLLDDFQAAFAALEPRGWEWARVRVNRFHDQIDQAYQQVTGQAVHGIIDRHQADYKVSIEDFAEQVDAYIRKQADKNFRLNFFVDEVGQYIAGNTKLMTNLQTIAESLATKCKGRAWIVVTAQEDMDTVVGEMDKQEGNDFSKIQDRFANRMKLTSQDVAEVIQKRLLAKTSEAVEQLGPLYDREVNNFKTLFDFSDGSQTYRNFRDRQHFIDCYPFVPYQFSLFQSAIQNLSKQNAFEGRHSSVGERSMLGVFQQVAVTISQHELGELATFDLMFEGIRAALKSQIQRSILVAEKHLDNPLAVRLLKALFLVKYVREFKPTIRNLCILMLDRFGGDLPRLAQDVQEALNLLESQVYIQRNGELYEFLTDDEKDVEQEIQNTEVEAQDVAEELSKIIYDQVLKNRKLRCDETKQDYPFSRKLDDRIYGREYELALHVISPFHDNFERIDQLKMLAMGRAELLIVLPADHRLIRDLTLYRQTDKYIRQNISLTQQETVKRILSNKTFTNKQRHADLVENVKDALGNARMFVAAAEVESGSHDPHSRIYDGFEVLIRSTYTNLRMLRGITYTEGNIEQCLSDSSDGLFANDATAMSEAETELLSFIARSTNKGIRVTVKALVEEFEKRPFGWYLAAILCTLAKLCGRGKVETRADSEILEDSHLAAALKNTRVHGNLVLEPQIEFTASQIRRGKEFYHDFFDRPPKSTEAKALGEELAAGFQTLHDELAALHARSAEYPFLAALADPAQEMMKLAAKSFKFFLTEFETRTEKLLEQKDSLLDPVRRFMAGSPAELYADVAAFVKQQEANFPSVQDEGIAKLHEILADPQCYRNSGIQQAKGILDRLRQTVEQRIAEERTAAAERLANLRQRLESLPEYAALPAQAQSEIQTTVDQVIGTLAYQTLIAVIRDTVLS
ncbi:MAG: BREX system P-loop protein BrxC, partial [Planctomycetota bacterium]|nr:BREX system P-loop protein BrxC [Planctomycetota bacterium]